MAFRRKKRAPRAKRKSPRPRKRKGILHKVQKILKPKIDKVALEKSKNPRRRSSPFVRRHHIQKENPIDMVGALAVGGMAYGFLINPTQPGTGGSGGGTVNPLLSWSIATATQGQPINVLGIQFTPNGSVTFVAQGTNFTQNSTANASGNINFNVPTNNVAVGTYTVFVTDNASGKSTPTATVTINASSGGPTVFINSITPSPIVGAASTVNVSITNAPSGTLVVFSDDLEGAKGNAGNAPANGPVNMPITWTTAGNHRLTVTVGTASNTVLVIVTAATSTPTLIVNNGNNGYQILGSNYTSNGKVNLTRASGIFGPATWTVTASATGTITTGDLAGNSTVGIHPTYTATDVTSGKSTTTTG